MRLFGKLKTHEQLLIQGLLELKFEDNTSAPSADESKNLSNKAQLSFSEEYLKRGSESKHFA